jgi:hypothetical protein
MGKEAKPIEREYVGVGEAEILSGRSKWTWRRDCYEGRVASVKLGRRLLIPMSEIRRVMAEGLRPRLAEFRDDR